MKVIQATKYYTKVQTERDREVLSARQEAVLQKIQQHKRMQGNMRALREYLLASAEEE